MGGELLYSGCYQIRRTTERRCSARGQDISEDQGGNEAGFKEAGRIRLEAKVTDFDGKTLEDWLGGNNIEVGVQIFFSSQAVVKSAHCP